MLAAGGMGTPHPSSIWSASTQVTKSLCLCVCDCDLPPAHTPFHRPHKRKTLHAALCACVRVCVWWGGLEAWASAFDPAFDPPLQSTFTHTLASQLRCHFPRPADGTPLVGVEATCRQELEFFVEGLNQPDTDDEAAGPAGMLDPALAAALGHPVGAAAYRFGGRGAGGKKRGKKPRYFR